MTDFDASTPQLKLVKKLADAYLSLETSNIEPLLSKNYQYEALPDFPKQTKEGHLQMWEGIFSTLNKLELIYHEAIDAPGKVDLHVTCVFSTVSGATFNYDTIFTYTLVKEGGELKILRCKDSGDPQQRNAIIAETVKTAPERVS